MVYQVNREFNSEINKFGCMMMSIIYLAFKKQGKEMTHEAVKAIYDMGKKTAGIGGLPIIGADCYINDLVGLSKIAGWPLTFVGKFEPTVKVENDWLIVQKWRYDRTGFEHFVVGKQANYTGLNTVEGRDFDRRTVEYDPIGHSKTVGNGYIKRITAFK